MKRNSIFAAIGSLALLACAENAVASTLTITKTATCGCCDGWVEHMKKAGFAVAIRPVDDVGPTAQRLGVPDALRSCHTSEIEGYAVEGHVPAADVRRLLATRPGAAGIAVPGMPMGAPGMEHGSHKQPYQTLLFDKAGKTSMFAKH